MSLDQQLKRWRSAELITSAQADRIIAEAEARVIRQEEIIVRLEAAGHDTADAKRLLELLRQGLVLARAHRELILKVLGTRARLGGRGEES